MATTDVSVLKRRRGTVKASITKLTTKITELVDKDPDQSNFAPAQQLAKRLEKLDDEYRVHHLSIVDLTEDETQLSTEQEALDTHDEGVAELNLKLQAVMISIPPPSPTPTTVIDSHSNRTVLRRRSAQLQVRLLSIHGKIGDLNDDGSEVHLIHLYQEHLADLKRELSELRNEILTISADVSDQLLSDTQRQEDNVFEMSVKVKKLLFLIPSMSSSTERTTTNSHAVKLPKIDVPTFDGELLHWQTFWEQFNISVD